MLSDEYYRMNVEARGNVTQRLQECDEHTSLSHSPAPNCWGGAGTEDRVFFLRNKSKRLDNKKLII